MAIYNKPVNGSLVQKDLPIFGLSRLGVYNRATATSTYEITAHLGNVRAVIQKVAGNPVIQSYADYYPFGEQLPARNALSNYRYAFQGQELDGETQMEAFQLRLWDGRIGRWLSPDPMGQYDSPYLGMGNNPVSLIDSTGGSTDDPGDSGKGFWGRLWGGITSLFGGVKDVQMGTLKDVVVFTRPKAISCNPTSNNFNDAFGSYNFYDPWPDSKWRWFEDHQSGSIMFGSGPMNGSERDYGGKIGKFGARYPTMDDQMATGGGGGAELKFVSTAANVVPHILRFVKDYTEAKHKGVELRERFGFKKDTIYTVLFSNNQHHFSIMGLKGQKQVDSIKLVNPNYSNNISITSIK